MKIAVVMDPLHTVRVDHDTTYVLMVEADRRGHAVYHVGMEGVEFEAGGARLRGRPVRPTGVAAQPFEIGVERTVAGADIDAVLIRTDPPFDADYLAVTQLLDLLPPRVFVMNAPKGLRDANEKLAALAFPELGPPSCVSQDPGALDEFRRAQGGAVVVKPLDGHGGEGVLLVREEDPNRRALLRAVTRGGRVKALAQAVVPGAEAGDKRIIVLDGEPLGAVLRRNDAGQFVHNLAAGGSAYPATVSAEDRALCARIAPWLRARGLWLAGLDLIGGRLIEVNVTSPTCVQEIDRFDGAALEATILDFVEARAAQASSSRA